MFDRNKREHIKRMTLRFNKIQTNHNSLPLLVTIEKLTFIDSVFENKFPFLTLESLQRF